MESVVIVAETQTMYDLDVETVDTFAVGDGAWVVHNCDIPKYAIGNLGESNAVRTHNLETLALYKPGETTVFSSVYDIHSRRWIGFPSEGTVLKSGEVPPIGFAVRREGGHETAWDNWRRFDSQVTQTNRGEGGLVGFTLFYISSNKFGIRWTSRSINMKNWMIDMAPENYTSIFGGDPIPLRAPVRQHVTNAIGFDIVDLTHEMGPPKPRP